MYVDYKAEQLYNQAVDNGDDVSKMWNGIIEGPIGGDEAKKVSAVVDIPAPPDISYQGTPYTGIDNKLITLTIAPNDYNENINAVKVYYKKFNEREISYKLVCKNENSPYTEVDYDEVTGDPLYGSLSLNNQTVENYDSILPSVSITSTKRW